MHVFVMVTEMWNTRTIRIRHGDHIGAESEVCTILTKKLAALNKNDLRYRYDFLIIIYLFVFLGFVSPIQSSENGKS